MYLVRLFNACVLAVLFNALAQAAEPKSPEDILKVQGNVAPKILRFTPEQEAAILKDVKVPEGFEVTLFANSAAAIVGVSCGSATLTAMVALIK